MTVMGIGEMHPPVSGGPAKIRPFDPSGPCISAAHTAMAAYRQADPLPVPAQKGGGSRERTCP